MCSILTRISFFSNLIASQSEPNQGKRSQTESPEHNKRNLKRRDVRIIKVSKTFSLSRMNMGIRREEETTSNFDRWIQTKKNYWTALFPHFVFVDHMQKKIPSVAQIQTTANQKRPLSSSSCPIFIPMPCHLESLSVLKKHLISGQNSLHLLTQNQYGFSSFLFHLFSPAALIANTCAIASAARLH